MQRVLVLGRGGAGKTTLSRQLSHLTGIPLIELDERFWSAGAAPLSSGDWARLQGDLVAADRWILDGDLGPYDVLPVRLAAADTIIVLDFPFLRCAWQAGRRSREATDFWLWVWHYRRRSVPLLREALSLHAPGATLHWLTTPGQARQLLAQVGDARPT